MMLRRLCRYAVRLHPSGFRQRFGDEMLYIFDQQESTLAALGVTLDCALSLLRQWTLRAHIGAEVPASALRSSTAENIPLFESLDAFQPRTAAIIHGALLSLVLFYLTVSAIPYSWSHVLNVHFPGTAGDLSQPLSWAKKSSQRLQVDVIPSESEGLPRKVAAVGPRQTHELTIWLDRYVGEYVSKHPPAKIWIRIENDAFRGDHLSLSLASAGQPSFALSPVAGSLATFVVAGLDHRYVEFSTDVQGRICCLSFVMDGNAITAQRQ